MNDCSFHEDGERLGFEEAHAVVGRLVRRRRRADCLSEGPFQWGKVVRVTPTSKLVVIFEDDERGEFTRCEVKQARVALPDSFV